jgi:hypothetical protein
MGRELLWSTSTLKRVRKCGRAIADADSDVGIVRNGDVAHFTNVQTCGSVHSCPVCSPRIRTERAQEIEKAAVAHMANGGGLLFLTLTVRHHKGQRLGQLVDIIAAGFSHVLSGRQWIEDRTVFGIEGTIRAFEVTHGGNGWHPHLHVLVFTSRPLDVGDVQALEVAIGRRWDGHCARSGLGSINEHGCVIRRVTKGNGELFRYLTKVEAPERASRARGSIGLELTRHDLKAARRKGRNPWAILANVAATGDVEDLKLWQEYEQATFRRQALTWSKGLKARYAIGERTDEEIAAEEIGGDVIATMPHWVWRKVTATRGLAARLLDAAERNDGADVVRLLRDNALTPPDLLASA